MQHTQQRTCRSRNAGNKLTVTDLVIREYHVGTVETRPDSGSDLEHGRGCVAAGAQIGRQGMR